MSGGTFAWAAAHRLDVAQKPLNDARVRRAIRMAVDTNEVIQKTVYGAGVPSGPLPTGFGGWPLDPQTLPYQKPDIEGARKLLVAAGYPNGGVTFTIKCSPQYPEFVAFSSVLQESVKKIGVTVNLERLEWGAFLKDLAQPFNFEAGATAWTFRSDPDGYLFPFFHSTGVFNAGPYRNPRVDRLLEEARHITVYAERRRVYQDIQRILLDDAAAWWYYVKINFEGAVCSDSGLRPIVYRSPDVPKEGLDCLIWSGGGRAGTPGLLRIGRCRVERGPAVSASGPSPTHLRISNVYARRRRIGDSFEGWIRRVVLWWQGSSGRKRPRIHLGVRYF